MPSILDPPDVLREPDVMLTHTPRIPGTDGRKMSKSYGNAIMLAESDEAIWEKIRPDDDGPCPQAPHRSGRSRRLPRVRLAQTVFAARNVAWAADGCRTAGIGCIECKRAMADNLIKWIAPVRERRRELESNPARVLEILDAGSKRARATAITTMERVREAVFGWKQKRAEISALPSGVTSAGGKK